MRIPTDPPPPGLQVGLAPTKAKNLVAMAGLLLERHGGEVPRTFEELEALPGVGHKTASVIMSQAFGVVRGELSNPDLHWGFGHFLE